MTHAGGNPVQHELEFRRDLLWAAVLALIAGLAVRVAAERLGPDVLHYSTWDFWFESDPPAVADQLLDRLSRNHLRASHHPLFSLIVYPIVQLLHRWPGATADGVFTVLLSAVAAAWLGMVFVTLRAMRLSRLDAGVFGLLAAASASAMFWFPVLEANAFGALSIVAAIAAVAFADRGRAVPVWICFLISLATLAFTTTNWMFGLLMLGAVLPLRRAVRTAAATLGAASALWVVQKLTFPTAGFPLNLYTPAETDYLFNPEALGIGQKLVGFLFHSIVLPEIGDAYGFRLSVQGMSPGAGSLLSGVGVIIWVLLLAGAGLAVKDRHRSKTVVVLLLATFGQLLLTLLFGIETFFYSLYFGPILVLVSALGSLTRARPIVVSLATVLVILAAANHVPKFNAAADRLHNRFDTERRFTAAVLKLTSPDGLILCGRPPLAAVGEPAPALEAFQRPPSTIVLDGDPDTCYYRFSAADPRRSGWLLPYERWSKEAVEAFRGRGARYFVTGYHPGTASAQDLFDWLDTQFRRLEAPPGVWIYDLRADGSPQPQGVGSVFSF
jgi:hypothetical protein